MAKRVDKQYMAWSTVLEIAEKIYANFMENPAYSCDDAQRDFDLYNYVVIDYACRIVNNRLGLEGKDEMLPWSV